MTRGETSDAQVKGNEQHQMKVAVSLTSPLWMFFESLNDYLFFLFSTIYCKTNCKLNLKEVENSKSADSCYNFRYTALLTYVRLALESPINIGADDRSRTCDLMITNQLLYQLSYIGI